MKAALVALLGLAGVSYAQTVAENGLKFEGNVTVKGDEGQFQFRHTAFTVTDFISTYTSSAADFKGDQNSGSFKADGIIGFVTCPSGISIPGLGDLSLLKYPPSVSMAYFSADANYNLNGADVNADVSASGAFAATVYSDLVEIGADGSVVKNNPLKNLVFKAGNINTQGELKFVTYTADAGSYDVMLTFAVSSVLGKLNVGGATITPKSMEAFFEVHNYPYKDVKNHLRLVLYLANASGEKGIEYTGTHTVIAGKGDNQVYFHLSGEAVADGNTVSVKVDGYTNAKVDPTELDNALLQGKLTGHGSGSHEVRKATIDFPAGAVKISYDPTLGFGAPDSAALLVPSIFSVLLAVLLVFYTF